MLPYEYDVTGYIAYTKNHVLYRSTPVFSGSEPVPRGVHLEAYSIEDHGEGISFNIFCYNVQPGIEIDYLTGDNKLEGEAKEPEDAKQLTENSGNAGIADQTEEDTQASPVLTYVLNTNTRKFHYPDCNSVKQMKAKNKKEVEGTRDEVIAMGYDPCGNCHP